MAECIASYYQRVPAKSVDRLYEEAGSDPQQLYIGCFEDKDELVSVEQMKTLLNEQIKWLKDQLETIEEQERIKAWKQTIEQFSKMAKDPLPALRQLVRRGYITNVQKQKTEQNQSRLELLPAG